MIERHIGYRQLIHNQLVTEQWPELHVAFQLADDDLIGFRLRRVGHFNGGDIDAEWKQAVLKLTNIYFGAIGLGELGFEYRFNETVGKQPVQNDRY